VFTWVGVCVCVCECEYMCAVFCLYDMMSHLHVCPETHVEREHILEYVHMHDMC